jgi:hypothetical protein
MTEISNKTATEWDCLHGEIGGQDESTGQEKNTQAFPAAFDDLAGGFSPERGR